MTSPSIKHLITLGEEVLDPSLSLEETLTRLEAYATLFDVWFAGHQATIGAEGEVDALEAVHHRVVEHSSELLKGTSAEIAKLKLKGKGILAYTDTLPKKISFRRPRKG